MRTTQNRKKSVLQSFYPNKLVSFACFMFFAGCSVLFWEQRSSLIFLSCILLSLTGLLLLFPNLTYVRITDEGIIHKNVITLFREEKISWNLIDNFYIESFQSGKKVKIKFKKKYPPNFAEGNLLIPGNPDKVLKILRDYLVEYSEKDLS